MKQNLKFRKAQNSDISNLVLLMNTAYRQTEGSSWTSEADIVTGDRINATQLEGALAQADFELWVATLEGEVIACIGLTFSAHDVEIGTFCIAPQFQNQGIGKQVLEYAEHYVQNIVANQRVNLQHFVMWVLSVRSELIAYYQRRDYQMTGTQADYPLDANVGQPLVDLHLIEMKKRIA